MTKDYIHKHHPKTVGRTEFWKQIKRTVNGREVSETDISHIITAVKTALELNTNDYLLDLGCGNAALASNFFPMIKSYHGVDFSTYLLEIAGEYFHIPGKTSFQELDLNARITPIKNYNEVNKVLIYGVASYLQKQNLINLIQKLSNYKNIEKIYIGNVPDRSLASRFFAKRDITDFRLDDEKSDIGIWWDADELIQIFEENNFECDIKKMPKDFYAAEYRFDVLGHR